MQQHTPRYSYNDLSPKASLGPVGGIALEATARMRQLAFEFRYSRSSHRAETIDVLGSGLLSRMRFLAGLPSDSVRDRIKLDARP